MYFTLLDLLRFISSIAVLFHHTFFFEYGKLGVYLFFIISGFVIYFSLRKGMKDYVIGRFVRLFPIFWLCCTLSYLVTVAYGVNLPLKNYFISMLMFNDGKIASMVDGSYWTLTFELLFYFYIGVFVWLFSTRHLVWFYALWLSASFLAFFFHYDQNIIFKLLSIRFAPYFVFGGVLALVVDRWKTSTLQMKSFYGAILLACTAMPPYITDSLNAQKDTISNFTGAFLPDELLIVESFFILIPLVIYLSYASFANGKRFSKICFVLGGITYPLYLLHWTIGKTIISRYQTYTEITLLSVSVAAGLILVSYLLSTYEYPIRKYLKVRLEKLL